MRPTAAQTNKQTNERMNKQTKYTMPQFPTTWGIPLCKNINKGADQVLKLCHIKAYL
jgi:hypothetical protein